MALSERKFPLWLFAAPRAWPRSEHLRGFVRRNARGACATAMPWLMVTRSDISQLPRSDPFGRDDVLRSPLSLRNVEDLLAERGVRVRIIDLIVEPLGDGHYVVAFVERPVPAASRDESAAPEPSNDSLERELAATRERLQATVDELETSNEEMKFDQRGTRNLQGGAAVDQRRTADRQRRAQFQERSVDAVGRRPHKFEEQHTDRDHHSRLRSAHSRLHSAYDRPFAPAGRRSRAPRDRPRQQARLRKPARRRRASDPRSDDHRARNRAEGARQNVPYADAALPHGRQRHRRHRHDVRGY
jgi:hypothetical protein